MLEGKKRGVKGHPIPPPPRKELEELYLQQRLGSLRISRKYEVSTATVQKWLHEYNIPVRPLSEARTWRKFSVPPKKELENLRLKERYGLKDIAAKYKVSENTAYRWLEIYSLIPKIPTREEMVELYVKKKLSGPEIARELKLSISTVYDLLIKYNIPRRNSSSYIGRSSPTASHYKIILKVAKKLENDGFKVIPIGKVIPDIIAFKNGKLYAVEVVSTNPPDYKKYKNLEKYVDEIVWVDERYFGLKRCRRPKLLNENDI